MNEKIRAARLSIASNTVLTLAKLAAGLFMNSVSVLSEAIHSGLDLVAALIAFFFGQGIL
jgi:divalent metal cation (Fe/Co/Zn/Cd) transporter